MEKILKVPSIQIPTQNGKNCLKIVNDGTFVEQFGVQKQNYILRMLKYVNLKGPLIQISKFKGPIVCNMMKVFTCPSSVSGFYKPFYVFDQFKLRDVYFSL
jgi:hypothetical protein